MKLKKIFIKPLNSEKRKIKAIKKIVDDLVTPDLLPLEPQSNDHKLLLTRVHSIQSVCVCLCVCVCVCVSKERERES